MNNQNNQYTLGGYNQNQHNQQGMPVGNQQYNPNGNQQYMSNGFANINVAGNMGIEKKGDLGKISIMLTILGLFCCGITTIPGIICGVIAFLRIDIMQPILQQWLCLVLKWHYLEYYLLIY